MAKKKKGTSRRRGRARGVAGGLMGALTQAGYIVGGYFLARKADSMLRQMLPDNTMRGGALALGGAMLLPKMLPAGMSMIGTGFIAGGLANAAASAFPTLGITGPSSFDALSDMDVDELENRILEASSMQGLDDRGSALNGDDEGDDYDYDAGVNGLDDRESALNGFDDEEAEEDDGQYD